MVTIFRALVGTRRPKLGSAASLTLIMVAALICFNVVCGLLLYQARESAWKRAEKEAINVTTIIDRDILRNIEFIDLNLQAVQDAVSRPDVMALPPALRNMAIFDRSTAAHYLSSTIVMNERGDTTFASDSLVAPKLNGADREYFQVQKNNRNYGLFVGKPIHLRLTGEIGIPISRRLEHADGSFAGITMAVLKLDYFNDLFSKIEIGPNSAIVIGSVDGTLVMRVPYNPGLIGTNWSKTETYQKIQKSAWNGSLRYVSAIDNIDRYLVYRKLGNLPMFVSVATSVNEIVAPWWYNAIISAVVMCSISVLMIFMVYQVVQELRRRELAERHASSMSADLRELANTLELRVEAEIAAREKAQVQLAQTQRLEALGQLAGGIAHDFNNILHSVSGAAHLLMQRAGDATAVARMANMLIGASDRGAAITGRLLTFSRKSELREQGIDSASLLENLREILAHTLGNNIDIKISLPHGAAPRLFADRAQLETVLVNMATNARDAMPRGGTLTFSASVDEIVGDVGGVHLPAGPYIRLSIQDTGAGMDAATLARASEPFFTTKEAGKGTGLGLSMARGFAEQSGGAFGIESVVGQGTTISLWFKPETTDAALPAAHRGTDIARTAPHATLLMVDDDHGARDTLAEAMTGQGHKVEQASDGRSALATLQSGRPIDLIITDLSMPGMDGIELIDAARLLHPNLPAIIMTGYAGTSTEAAVRERLGQNCYLVKKPITVAELDDQVAALLEFAAVQRQRSSIKAAFS